MFMVSMKRFKVDVVSLEQSLVAVQSVQKLTLGKSALPFFGKKASWYAICFSFEAVCTGKRTITADFALLAEDAGQHAGGLCIGGRLRLGVGVGHCTKPISTDYTVGS